MTFVLVFVAAVCVGVSSRYFFYGSSSSPTGFWGSQSWKRKYKLDGGKLIPIKTPSRYEQFFKIKYKERFLFSTNALVFVTDAAHLMQFFAIKLGLLALVFPNYFVIGNPVIGYIILHIIYYMGFNFGYTRK